MRKLLLLCLSLLCCIPVFAADEVTVAQLGQRIAAARHESDRKLAKQIAGLQLTERLSHLELTRLNMGLPGERSRSALMAIADASAFLPPPRSEMIMEVGPPAKTQGEILLRATQFVANESRRMPNFLAQRITTRFQDAVHFPYSTHVQFYTPINYHFVDRRLADLRYVEGQEQETKPNHPPKKTVERDILLFPKGLTTWGAFGPLLETVITDILQSKVGWDYWERSDTGRLAVFRFAVPKEQSHYTVEYCCMVNPNNVTTEYKATPAYHGDITIDPATGHVLRIVLICDLAPGQVINRADVELEYGPVDIAGKNYFLPIRGVSASATPAITYHPVGDSGYAQIDRYVTTSINDLQFQNYRVFRTEMRILPQETAGGPDN